MVNIAHLIEYLINAISFLFFSVLFIVFEFFYLIWYLKISEYSLKDFKNLLKNLFIDNSESFILYFIILLFFIDSIWF